MKKQKLLLLGGLSLIFLGSCEKEDLNTTDRPEEDLTAETGIDEEQLQKMRQDSIEETSYDVFEINSIEDLEKENCPLAFLSDEEYQREIANLNVDERSNPYVYSRMELFENTGYNTSNGHMHIANTSWRWNSFYNEYSRPADYKGGIKYNDERYITQYGAELHREVRRYSPYSGYVWDVNTSMRGGNIGSFKVLLHPRTRVYLIVVDEDGNRHGRLRVSNNSYSNSNWYNLSDAASLSFGNGYTAQNVSKYNFTSF